MGPRVRGAVGPSHQAHVFMCELYQRLVVCAMAPQDRPVLLSFKGARHDLPQSHPAYPRNYLPMLHNGHDLIMATYCTFKSTVRCAGGPGTPARRAGVLGLDCCCCVFFACLTALVYCWPRCALLLPSVGCLLSTAARCCRGLLTFCRCRRGAWLQECLTLESTTLRTSSKPEYLAACANDSAAAHAVDFETLLLQSKFTVVLPGEGSHSYRLLEALGVRARLPPPGVEGGVGAQEGVVCLVSFPHGRRRGGGLLRHVALVPPESQVCCVRIVCVCGITLGRVRCLVCAAVCVCAWWSRRDPYPCSWASPPGPSRSWCRGRT